MISRIVQSDSWGNFVWCGHEVYRPSQQVAQHFPKLFAAVVADAPGDVRAVASALVPGTRTTVQPKVGTRIASVNGETWLATRGDPFGDLTRPAQSGTQLFDEIARRLRVNH